MAKMEGELGVVEDSPGRVIRGSIECLRGATQEGLGG